MSIKPARLRQGDTICFISPSGRINNVFPDRIARGKAFFEQLGYKVKIVFIDTLAEDYQEGILQRVGEIHEAFEDKSVNAIVTTIGGLSLNELLPFIDYDIIRRNPKILCGYSDVSLLHHAIFTQTGLRTFYGPAIVPQFGDFPTPLEFTTSHFFKALTSAEPLGEIPRSLEWTDEFLDWEDSESSKRPRKMEPNEGWQWIRKGKATGRLIGGCLPSCAQLFGTKFKPDYKDCILFLELPDADNEKNAMTLDEARLFLGDYNLNGIFAEVAGIVFGRPLRYSAEQRREFEKVLLQQCRLSNCPILANIDIGHTDPMVTVPFGAMASLDSEKDTFTILESGVE